MLPVHCFQFFVFSLCVHIFTLITYLVYYGDNIISSIYQIEIQSEYDYIIVGSGTAGSVIAHRLATETNLTFIVLEAGSRSNVLLDAPVIGPFMHRSLFDWHYETVPQDNACLAMKDRKCKLPQGKIKGGSSKLNNMVHFRGNISDYVNWFHGIHTEHYIKKQFEFVENKMLYLDELRYESNLASAILEAARELGYNLIGLEFDIGFRKSLVSQRNGQRWSTSDNIATNVFSNALVEKVLFTGNTASGILFSNAGNKRSINARKGVIISAGTYNSPKILQLSGIGPTELLKSLNIPVVKNLPVGRNLQEHVASGMDLILFNDSIALDANAMINPYNVIRYIFKGTGPWTTPGCEVVGFLSTNNTSPDIQFMVLPVGISADRGSLLRKSLGIRDDIWDNYFAKIYHQHAATILPIVLYPKSKGTVYINSTDPEKPPLIDPQFLSRKEDRVTLKAGLKLVSKFITSEAMASIGAYLNPIPFPNCETFEFFSDSYLECYIKQLTLTGYHPVGTCSMGLPGAKNAVVNTSFKVLGVHNLYVADASVLPALPSGNINAAVAMMGSIFFDTTISRKKYYESSNIGVCFKNDYLFEYIFNVCFNES